MRQESTGKPDPERASATEPAQKRGFFAAAGARLKRVIGARSEPAAAVAPASAPVSAPENLDAEGEAEVSTSVQARARELLLQDRATGAGRARVGVVEPENPEAKGEAPPRRSGPPPLPSQRMAASLAADGGEAEQPSTGVTAIPRARRRPQRDSKSDALRARLGAAKAALAEAQAKRAVEPDLPAPSVCEGPSAPTPGAAASEPTPTTAESERELTVEPADLIELPQEQAAEDSSEPSQTAAEGDALSEPAEDDDDPEIELGFDELDELDELFGPQPAATTALATVVAAAENAAALSGDSGRSGLDAQPSTRSENGAEPIRTLTIARLLARQGYYERSLSIYDELLAAGPTDPALHAEAEKIRAKKRSKKSEG